MIRTNVRYARVTQLPAGRLHAALLPPPQTR